MFWNNDMMLKTFWIFSIFSFFNVHAQRVSPIFLGSSKSDPLSNTNNISNSFVKVTESNDFRPILTRQRTLEEISNEDYTELFSFPFVGIWHSKESNDKTLFDEFTKRSGKIRFSFNTGFGRHNRLIWFEEKQPPLREIDILIIDGEYHDDYFYLVGLDDDKYQELNISNGTLTIHKASAFIGPFENCDVVFEMNLNSLYKDNTEIIDKNGFIHLQMSSQNCTINLEANVYIDSFDSNAKTRYNIFFRALMIISAITNLKLASKILKYSHQRNKVSSVMFVVLSVWDMIFLSNMYVPPSLDSVDMSKGFLFIEMLLYETAPSFLLLIPFWMKTQSTNINLNGNQVNQLLWLYVFLPTSIMVFFIVLSVQVFFQSIFLYLINFYLVPQIIYNFIRGSPVPFEPSTIALIISVRPLYLLYLKAYSGNIYQVSTSFTLTIMVLMTLAAQIIVLYLQSCFGVRFFIPRERLFSGHNYLDISSTESMGTELLPMRKICTICMEERSESPTFNETWLPEVKPLLERLKLQPGKILKTNCKHKFHAVCLLEWMMINMKCPKCGEPLKPLD